MPSLRQLEYLLALRQTAHFRRAAERVGVSQPTLSAQLKTLEDRLGVQVLAA
jgi:LysR family transcriptional regulator, hydrogen peroxide-inducible genes activator